MGVEGISVDSTTAGAFTALCSPEPNMRALMLARLGVQMRPAADGTSESLGLTGCTGCWVCSLLAAVREAIDDEDNEGCSILNGGLSEDEMKATSRDDLGDMCSSVELQRCFLRRRLRRR